MTFTVTINLPTAHDNVVIEDIFAVAGKVPDTAFVVGSSILTAPGGPITPSPTPVLVKNLTNWVQYNFNLGNLATRNRHPDIPLEDQPKLGCYTQASNEVHLDYAGITGHVDTRPVAFQIRGC